MQLHPTLRGLERQRPGFAISTANVIAGLSTIFLYASGPVPFYLATAGQYAPDRLAVAGLGVAFITAGVGTIALALFYRQPLAVGWSLPALAYMAAAASHYTASEMAAAVLATGIVTGLLAWTGLTEQVSRRVPVPVVMGVLAGSALAYCTGTVDALQANPAAAAAPVAGYFLAKALRISWLSPVSGAMLAGLPAALLLSDAGAAASLSAPSLHGIAPSPALASIATLTLPLVLLTVMGNLQGEAILEAEGFDVPRRPAGLVLAAMTVVHAFFAAPPATYQRASLAVMAGAEAGERPSRFVAAIIASIGAIAIGLGAASVAAVMLALPTAFTQALIGLILLGVVLEALKKTVEGTAPLAGFVAFVVAASSFEVLGFGSALWALAAGIAVTVLDTRSPSRSAPALPETVPCTEPASP